MESSVKISEDKKYIIITYKGKITRANSVDPPIVASKIVREIGVNKFLIDLLECRNEEQLLDQYEYSYEDTKEKGFLQDAIIAMLVKITDHSHDFIALTLNKSGRKTKIVHSLDEALDFFDNN